MAATPGSGKLYRLFTFPGAFSASNPGGRSGARRTRMVIGLAIAMFIALFGWGSTYFGWSDPEGKVQLALVTSFILGIIGGFKAKG
jgi:hypothetical protein